MLIGFPHFFKWKLNLSFKCWRLFQSFKDTVQAKFEPRMCNIPILTIQWMQQTWHCLQNHILVNILCALQVASHMYDFLGVLWKPCRDLLFLFYRAGNWSSGLLSDLPKVTQQESGRTWTHSLVSRLSALLPAVLPYCSPPGHVEGGHLSSSQHLIYNKCPVHVCLYERKKENTQKHLEVEKQPTGIVFPFLIPMKPI